CDVWHSIDICASTASINSLLIIALDRHSAISDPINYHDRRLTRHWLLFVLLIWIGSAFISFPAIAYWRWLTPIYPPNQCHFPNDLYYLVFSSLVSFYIPLPIMIFVYVRMYRAATTQMNALKTGQKLNCKTADGKPLILRIHRGGANSQFKSINPKATIQKQNTCKTFELSKSLECLLVTNLSSMGPFSSSFSSLIQHGPAKTPTRSCSLQNVHLDCIDDVDSVKMSRANLVDRMSSKMDRVHRKYGETKKFLDVHFDGSRKKLLLFYSVHYHGHSKLMSDVRSQSHRTHGPAKHNSGQVGNVRCLFSSFRTRCKRTDSNLSNSNFYLFVNCIELKLLQEMNSQGCSEARPHTTYLFLCEEERGSEVQR
ncbi:dopamine receptor 2-like, partial [Brachionus plicatilis]